MRLKGGWTNNKIDRAWPDRTWADWSEFSMTTPYSTRNQQRSLAGMILVCALVLAAGVWLAPDRTWSNLLVAAFYLLTLGLGGAVFVALTYVTGAGWHVAFRRIPETLAKTLPLAGGAMILVLFARASAYGWSHGEGDAGTFWFKEIWLTPAFWLIRAVIYIVAWSFLSRLLVTRSQQQDETGDATLTRGNVRLSALFLAVYAVTFSLASIDWIMALDPLWFSTMWGVYNFSGMIQAALAAVIILGLVMRAPGGPLQGIFRDEHLHDLGKLLIGFSCFWMYIWFSQYMLIWYSNIPEETSYFIHRIHGSWGPVVVLSIILNWIVPFFVLLPMRAKRSAGVMMKVAGVVLIGRWVDLYLMVFPSVGATGASETKLFEAPVFGLWEVAGIGCLAAVTGLLVIRCFAATNPVPKQDPYLSESLHYHAG